MELQCTPAMFCGSIRKCQLTTSQVGRIQDAVRKWQIIVVYNIRCVCLLGFYLLATAEPFEKATLCFPNLAMIFLQFAVVLVKVELS